MLNKFLNALSTLFFISMAGLYVVFFPSKFEFLLNHKILFALSLLCWALLSMGVSKLIDILFKKDSR